MSMKPPWFPWVREGGREGQRHRKRERERVRRTAKAKALFNALGDKDRLSFCVGLKVSKTRGHVEAVEDEPPGRAR